MAFPHVTYVNALSRDADIAGRSGTILQHLIDDKVSQADSVVRLSLEHSTGTLAEFSVPAAALKLLASLLTEMGHGKEVAVVATDSEVTTQQAAEILNVSRPYVVKLLKANVIPYRSVGPRRRILLADLLRYKEHQESERHRGLDELVAESQRLGLY